MLERYGHGGDLQSAMEVYGGEQERFIDFSSNMNPFGPPNVVQDMLRTYADHIFRYPDPASRELRAAVADRYGVPEDSVFIGNGAAECIDLAAKVWHPQNAGLARPCFSEYEEAVIKAGGAVHEIPLKREHGFRLQPEDLEQAFRVCDTLFLGHPNNPSGSLIGQNSMHKLMESSCRIVLDEAFIDFIDDEETVSAIRHAAQSPSWIVIRSMTKFYAVPGIRLGFAVAHPETIRAMRSQQIPWSVNSLAQRLGPVLLAEKEYAIRTKEWLVGERQWLTEQLIRLGAAVYPSDTNFLLFSLPEEAGMDAKQLQHQLGLEGILLRDGSRFPGLDETFCRIAIRLRKDNEALLEALGRLLHNHT